MRRKFLALFGILCTLMGLLWVLQGLGLVHWPRTSFMIAQSQWAIRGGLLMALGLVLVHRSRQHRD
ncbi:hypothetical protein KY084_00250 [Stakelama sp. CBK3Z-3]|uniref:Uncharacterized protein n=1 Tax=Stakelama flava TaxID=2860338 RepID=A0ABS6XHK5_9SPHN|nr:hypothetical protein [Stakelama flava]MBW4329308.1 hypothetical protein [Stakelama flava]